jgi:DNA repair protein RadC
MRVLTQRIKDLPKIDRPREKMKLQGPDGLTKSELLAIILGSGIKGKNVKKLSEQIIRKFGNNFLDLTVNDLIKVKGIGKIKALQIIAALALVKRFYDERESKESRILFAEDVISLNSDLKNKKKEYLVCLYLNARNVLLKKEVVSIGIHNHPSGNLAPSKQDIEVVNKIVGAGKIMGINVIDFIIMTDNNFHSFFKNLQQREDELACYVSDDIQYSLFDLLETETSSYIPATKKVHKIYLTPKKRNIAGEFQIQSRRFLGNKYKLLGFIEDIVNEKCNGFESFCDIFAGTGVVGERFNRKNIKIISNDLLFNNYISLKAFLGTTQIDLNFLREKIDLKCT